MPKVGLGELCGVVSASTATRGVYVWGGGDIVGGGGGMHKVGLGELCGMVPASTATHGVCACWSGHTQSWSG